MHEGDDVFRGWPEARLAELGLGDALADWVLERGSMTVRLQGRYPSVEVVVERQDLVPAPADEAASLGVPRGAPVWLRQVRLHCRGELLLQARTVVPGWAEGNAWHELQHLGTRPLGDLLFRMPDIERSPFELAWVSRWPDAAGALHDGPPRIARRCLYRRRGWPLLLTERLWLPGVDDGASAGAARPAAGQ